MTTIDQLAKDLAAFFQDLLSPTTLGIVISVGGIGYKLFKSIGTKMENGRKKTIDNITNQLTEMQKTHDIDHADLQKEILRLQLLEGMDSKRLSVSEVRYFYDKYKKAGGNSFVSEAVKNYIKDLEEKENERKRSSNNRG